MASTNELFSGSELSLAAYARLDKSIGTADQVNIDALKESGMTQTQAEQFALSWPEIVDQITHPSGLSFTIFRNGDEVNIAIRGTETSEFVDLFRDFLADLVLGSGQIPAQYAELKALYQNLKATNIIRATDTVTISGHSLGGFLAQLLAVDFTGDFEHAYTYNAPGIGGIPLDLFGIPDNVPTPDISNVRGDGFSLIATVGTSLGAVVDVQIENSLLTPADHTIKKLADSLLIFDILSRLDSTLTVEQYNVIFTASSGAESDSLENIASELYRLIVNNSLAIQDRENLHAIVQKISSKVYVDIDADNPVLASVYQDLTITPVQSFSMNELSEQAYHSIAHRYALLNLNPFVITGNDSIYAVHNQNGELNLENFSDQYLQDRAEFLLLNAQTNIKDLQSYESDYSEALFIDPSRGIRINNVNPASVTPLSLAPMLLFGSQVSDGIIEGRQGNDRLYGINGNDTLLGSEGDDILEGGKGEDFLIGGDGNDTLIGGVGARNGQFASDTERDELYGGSGHDTYYADENDVIVDDVVIFIDSICRERILALDNLDCA